MRRPASVKPSGHRPCPIKALLALARSLYSPLACQRHDLRPQHGGAVEAALMKQDLQEPEISPPGGIEPAAAAPKLAPRRIRAGYRFERAVGFALVNADQARLLCRRNGVAGVRHA